MKLDTVERKIRSAAERSALERVLGLIEAGMTVEQIKKALESVIETSKEVDALLDRIESEEE